MRHTISVLVENKFGVLARVSGMFSGRGFNIDSLNVAPTHDPSLSRITAVIKGDDASLDMVTKQLRKLVNVVEVVDFKEGQAVMRELVLAKIKADARTRSEIMQICDIFRAKIIDVQPKRLAVEITGSESKIDKFVALMEQFGITDLTRTGKIALARSK
jgi:acetolactate synthase-1/3 small subunit